MKMRGALVALIAASTLAGCALNPVAKPTPASPQVEGYTFAAGMVDAGAGAQTYTKFNGTIGIPATPGPHPVVVVVHGSYYPCITLGSNKLFTRDVSTTKEPDVCGPESNASNDALAYGPDYVRASASFATLVKELASRGFVVVAPDVHAKDALWSGAEGSQGPVTTSIVKAHLALLADLKKGITHSLPFAGALKGAVDVGSLAFVGHSSGGMYVLEPQLTKDFPAAKVAVALEPARAGDTDLTNSAALAGVMVVAGVCDEQVSGDREPRRLAADYAKANPRVPTVHASLAGTTHLGLLQGGGDTTIGMTRPAPNPRACTKARLAKPADMQTAAAQITADFIEQAMSGAHSLTIATPSTPMVKVRSLTSGVSLKTEPATSLPAITVANSVRFLPGTGALLPPAPAGLKLHWSKNGGNKYD